MARRVDPALALVCAPVLLDSSVIRNFTKVGFGSILASVFGTRGAITSDVFEELLRRVTQEPSLCRLLEIWPVGDPLELPPDLALEAADIAELLRPVDGHERENIGEITTVLIAERLIAEGQSETLVMLDDGDGQRLCDARGVPRVNTPGLVVELVVSGHLSQKDGARIWRGSFTDRRKWSGFEDRLALRRRDLGQA